MPEIEKGVRGVSIELGLSISELAKAHLRTDLREGKGTPGYVNFMSFLSAFSDSARTRVDEIFTEAPESMEDEEGVVSTLRHGSADILQGVWMDENTPTPPPDYTPNFAYLIDSEGRAIEPVALGMLSYDAVNDVYYGDSDENTPGPVFPLRRLMDHVTPTPAFPLISEIIHVPTPTPAEVRLGPGLKFHSIDPGLIRTINEIDQCGLAPTPRILPPVAPRSEQ